jgi:hypothetical protein
MPPLIPPKEPSESGVFEVTPSHAVADVVITAAAIFENVGRVPFHFNCWGVGVNSDLNPLSAAHCEGVITLDEQRTTCATIFSGSHQQHLSTQSQGAR